MLETTIEEIKQNSRNKAKTDTVLRGIKLGFDTKVIHDITEVSIEKIEKMRLDLKK